MTGLTMIGGAGMNCEGDSCVIPEAGAASAVPGAETAESAGVSAE